MPVHVCPTDIVRAPPERIWRQLVDPLALAGWTDTKLLEGPGRDIAPGDRLVFRAAPGMHAVFRVGKVNPPRELHIDVQLPLGIANREVIVLSPVEGGCRVTFN